MNKLRLILLIMAIGELIAIPSIAFANPIYFNPVKISGGLFFLFVLEGIVLSLLIGLKKIKPIKFIFIWAFITLITWIFFYLGISFFSRRTNDYPVLIAGEFTVVIAESFIFKAIVLSKKFMVESIKISIPKSLWFSFLANSASFVGGILVLLVFGVS